MPYITSSYSKPQQYTPTNSSIPQPTFPERARSVVYANTEDVSVTKPAREYSDIVYANTTKSITPAQLFSQLKKRIPEVIGNCGIDDDVFLELLGKQIALFTTEGSHKWNFLTIEQTLELEPGKESYELPDNYDQMIAVFIDKNCPLNNFGKTIEIIQVDSEKKNFVSGANYFEVKNNTFKLINYALEKKKRDCNYCGEDKCEVCKLYTGSIHLHYHIMPERPQNIDENMMWFPKNANAIEYFKERLIEDIYFRAGQTPYVSPSAEILFNGLCKWDHNSIGIQNKKNSDLVFIDFTKMMARRL